MRAERLNAGAAVACPPLRDKPPRPSALLTIRELEVAKLKAEGNQHKEIADKLHLSKKTVDTYVVAIYKKLHINSIAVLTKWAINVRLVDL